MTYFFIKLWRTHDVRPPLFIIYFIGLILAFIALTLRSSTLSAIAGMAMIISWYDFYSPATTIYKTYVQIIGIIGFVHIESAHLDIGAFLGGIMAFLHLTLGTYLIEELSQ